MNSMKKFALYFAAAAATVFSVVSCAGSPEMAGEWNVVKINGETVAVTDNSPFLSFDAVQGRVHGRTGVNIVNGSYTLEGNKLHLDGLGTTMMAGPEEDMQLEQKFLGAINDVVAVKSAGEGKLQLCGKDGNVLMELVKR